MAAATVVSPGSTRKTQSDETSTKHPPTRHQPVGGFFLLSRRVGMQRIDVGVLGATGMVGQQFIAQLADHPWFRLTWVGASERSAGQAYRSAAPWRLPVSIPAAVADLVVQEARPGAGHPPELLFSAMDASVAGEI